jgi:hypothetical protein
MPMGWFPQIMWQSKFGGPKKHLEVKHNTVEPPLPDASLLRTPIFSPNLVNFNSSTLSNQDTSQLSTAILSQGRP